MWKVSLYTHNLGHSTHSFKYTHKSHISKTPSLSPDISPQYQGQRLTLKSNQSTNTRKMLIHTQYSNQAVAQLLWSWSERDTWWQHQLEYNRHATNNKWKWIPATMTYTSIDHLDHISKCEYAETNCVHRLSFVTFTCTYVPFCLCLQLLAWIICHSWRR